MRVAITSFKGIAPKIPQRFLPEDMAAAAEDVEASGSSLKPLRDFGLPYAAVPNGVKTIYHFLDRWLVWPQLVDVVRSQIAGDEYEWTFYTGDGIPKATNKRLAPNTGGPPAGWVPLGVKPPTVAATPVAQDYDPEKKPAELTITPDQFSGFTQRFGLQVSVDGGKTFVPVTISGSTAEAIASGLNSVAGVSAEVVGGNVVVKTSTTGRDASIQVKFAEDDYTHKAGQGQDAWPPRLRIYQAHITTIAAWVADSAGRVHVHLHRGTPQPEWTHVFPRGAFNAQTLVSALASSGLVVSGMDGQDVYVETFHPHVGSGAHLGISIWQENRPANVLTFDTFGTNPTYAEVILTAEDLAALSTEDDIEYSLDGGQTYTKLQLNSNSAASVAAVFDAEPWLVAVTDSGSVVVKTLAAGYVLRPPDYPYDRVTLDVRYKTGATNAYSATGKTLDDIPKETRVYTYTYVSSIDGWERESAPAPASESIDVFPKQGVSVTITPSSEPQVTHWRLYRSVKGIYLFVGEAPIGTTSMVDALEAAKLGEELPSLTWDPPPDNLEGLINLPNGILAGFVGRDLYFCDPYHPHAWPANYQQTLDYPIVGLGRMDTTLAVLTTGVPYIVQGSHPDSLTAVKSDIDQSCVARRSIVSLDGAVYYASPDGLIQLTSSGATLVTAPLMTREQWQAMQPSTIQAYGHDGKYIAFYTNRSGGFVYDARSQQFYLHRRAGVTAAFNDLVDDRLYVAVNGAVRAWGEGAYVKGVWRSKLFSFPQITGFSCAQVGYEGVDPVEFRIFAASNLILSRTVTSRNPFRLPAVQARAWQVEVDVETEIYHIAFAQAMEEIALV